MWSHILKPSKYQLFHKRVFGFDIETQGPDNIFVCASVYDVKKDESYFFKDREECVKFFKTRMFMGAWIIATNLQFDFFGTMSDVEDCFQVLFRGSHLLYAKTYIPHDGLMQSTPPSSKRISPTMFLDTLNYAPFSVEKLGKIIGVKKLKPPFKLGRAPKNVWEWAAFQEYNEQDAKISALAFIFFMNSFQELGASPRITIASTAMSAFRNNYLNTVYYTHDEPVLMDQFKGYYGGRTEAFARGSIGKGYKLYDFNSLYPAMMRGEFPDPNSLRISSRNTGRYVDAYEGMSFATVKCPDTPYPLLPLRTDTKLLFPTGIFSGWYCHNELNRAYDLGYEIVHVKKSYYYKDSCVPFQEYVDDLYSKRLQYKEERSPMEHAVKLLLNSLYGKFGQKFYDKDDYVHQSQVTLSMLKDAVNIERLGAYFRLSGIKSRPSAFCFPIWASLITSKGRIHLHKELKKHKAIYCDTDSIITKEDIVTSSRLGRLKLEMKIDEGVIVRPKFYCVIGDKEYVKVKGVPVRMTPKLFYKLLHTGNISGTKFTKFRESLRRDMKINSVQEVVKNFSFEDTKRQWPEKFNAFAFQESKPINVRAIEPSLLTR